MTDPFQDFADAIENAPGPEKPPTLFDLMGVDLPVELDPPVTKEPQN